MSTFVTLIDKLKAKQAELKLNETDFCKKLGISRAQWFLLKKGSRQPGADFLGMVMRQFPDLTLDIMAYLKGGNHDN